MLLKRLCKIDIEPMNAIGSETKIEAEVGIVLAVNFNAEAAADCCECIKIR
jgi:hypothetical protein